MSVLNQPLPRYPVAEKEIVHKVQEIGAVAEHEKGDENADGQDACSVQEDKVAVVGVHGKEMEKTRRREAAG